MLKNSRVQGQPTQPQGIGGPIVGQQLQTR